MFAERVPGRAVGLIGSLEVLNELDDLVSVRTVLRGRVPTATDDVSIRLRTTGGDGGAEGVLCGLDDDLEVKDDVGVLRVRLGVSSSETAIDQFPKDDTEREDVRFGRKVLTEIDLRSAIGVGPSETGEGGHVATARGEAGSAKVRDLDDPVLVDEEVEGLEVAMDDLGLPVVETGNASDRV